MIWLVIDNAKTRRTKSKEAILNLENINVSIIVINGIHSKSVIFKTDKGMALLIEGASNRLSAVRDISNYFSRYEVSIYGKVKSLD